ncbi:MAG: Gfo/Idh/MocA family oxidoreductase [Anderseniella sp.]|jgi:predicted homoserine dehydrogenase-like protein|nr:Gfo/Idh/MocA family oxidoreductase [Anderseniella sp.]
MSRLPAILTRRIADHGPVRVGVIGAGKFSSMFLNQVPFSPHLQVVAIADLDVDRARKACRNVGWSDDLIAATRFTDDGMSVIADPAVEVVMEITGSPAAGCAHALAAAQHGKHIVMVNVEADVLAGPVLAAAHRSAGTVYSMASGDQPALVCEIVDWARTCGLEVVCAGKGTRYQPGFHDVTPDGVWDHYGLTAEQAATAGMNSQMFNSFLDGTKSAIEMAAIANANGLDAPEDGLRFPAVDVYNLQNVLIPAADGGIIDHSGMVEVVASEHRGEKTEMPNHLRWGVYAVFRAPNEYARDCFRQYGLVTDKSGWYAALYRPYHLIGLELGLSASNAVIRREPTGSTAEWRGDVAAVAKKDLKPGDRLDGEGGYCAWGRLMPAASSRARRALPIGLAHGVNLVRPVAHGQVISYDDVDALPDNAASRCRKELENSATS